MAVKTVTVNANCVFCHKVYAVTVDYKGFIAWQYGKLIQNALPNVSIVDREFLISKICPSCQNKFYNIPEPE